MIGHQFQFRRGPHLVAGVIRHLYRHFEQAGFARRLVIVHRRLAQRADVIHFVLPAVVAAVQSPAPVRMLQFRPGIDVTVRVNSLRGSDARNVTIDALFQRRIRMRRQK